VNFYFSVKPSEVQLASFPCPHCNHSGCSKRELTGSSGLFQNIYCPPVAYSAVRNYLVAAIRKWFPFAHITLLWGLWRWWLMPLWLRMLN